MKSDSLFAKCFLHNNYKFNPEEILNILPVNKESYELNSQ